MKAIWFLPFTFAAGAEGFALFVPYLLCFTLLLYLLRVVRVAKRELQAIPALAVPVLVEVQPV